MQLLYSARGAASALLLASPAAGAWVTCPDGTMANYGACPGPQGEAGEAGERGPEGPAGPQGESGEVRRGFAAMTIAAASIPWPEDATVGIGIGVGSMTGADAIAAGVSVRLGDAWRTRVTWMATRDDRAVGFGVGFGF